MEAFRLHPQLEADGLLVADWALCRVLLMNDSRFPWLLLVPRRFGAGELHDLLAADRMVLMEELVRASKALRAITSADKINVGALGNIVPQLHLHIIARKREDAAWPGPVWGRDGAVPYEEKEREALLLKLVASFRP